MNILALDTATKTGWAITVDGVLHMSGIEDFSPAKVNKSNPTPDHPGRRFRRFQSWLNNMLIDYKIDLISYESIVGGRNAGGHTTLIQKGLEAIVLMTASEGNFEDFDIPCWDFSAATIKKWATGSGTLSNDKRPMIAHAMKLTRKAGYSLTPRTATKSQPWDLDDNEADAVCLVDLTTSVFEHAGSVNVDPEQLTPIAQVVTAAKWHASKKRI